MEKSEGSGGKGRSEGCGRKKGVGRVSTKDTPE